MQIHLDLMGGLAGDMFIAAVLDAFPEHAPAVIETLSSMATRFEVDDADCRLVEFNDGVFQGRRFDVSQGRRHGHAHSHDHGHGHEHEHAHGHAHDHAHVAWNVIRGKLDHALPPEVLVHAIGIFEGLAVAEAAVHGVPVDRVEFHEVGAWDSIADIVGAACLIHRLQPARWSVSAIPTGSGRIHTAHGWMPVPAPATALMLRGFAMLDDGIAGERVTPTGAAILRYLIPPDHATQRTSDAGARARVLARSGVGFGTRRLPGISNCVRLLAFEDVAPDRAAAAASHRELAVVEFEVDDQSAEDLAMGLDRLRRHEAIFDVVQMPVFGKKGRMMSAVRLLARPSALADVMDACFRETTTIGLRHHIVSGTALARRSDEVVVEGHRLRVKVVERPGGATAKAESDDALAHETHRTRRRLRFEAERQVLLLQHGADGE